MKLKKTPLTEDQEQTKLAVWLEKNNIDFFAIPNGGTRHMLEAMKFKRCGVKRGVPDICIPIPIEPYHGLYIELKRVSKSVISPEQKYWNEKLNKNGYLTKFAYGFEEAKSIVESYLNM